MGSLAERSEWDTLKKVPDSASAPEASFIPLHTLVNAKLALIDDHNFDRRANYETEIERDWSCWFRR